MNVVYSFILLTYTAIALPDSPFVKLGGNENEIISKYCGWSRNQPLQNQNFKVFGKVANPGDFPWVVLLEKTGTYDVIYMDTPIARRRPRKETAISYCTGILISPRHILTAAHCLCEYKIWLDNRINRAEVKKPDCIRLHQQQITAILGDSSPIDVKMNNYYLAGNLAEVKSSDYDWGLLELERNVSEVMMEAGYVRPICIINSDSSPKQDYKDETWVAGCGVNENHQGRPTNLHYNELGSSLDPSQCQQYSSSPIVKCYDRNSQIGDSGMPYKKYDKDVRAYLTGIHSGASINGDIALVTDTESNDDRGPLYFVKQFLELNYEIKT